MHAIVEKDLVLYYLKTDVKPEAKSRAKGLYAFLDGDVDLSKL